MENARLTSVVSIALCFMWERVSDSEVEKIRGRWNNSPVDVQQKNRCWGLGL